MKSKEITKENWEENYPIPRPDWLTKKLEEFNKQFFGDKTMAYVPWDSVKLWLSSKFLEIDSAARKEEMEKLLDYVRTLGVIFSQHGMSVKDMADFDEIDKQLSAAEKREEKLIDGAYAAGRLNGMKSGFEIGAESFKKRAMEECGWAKRPVDNRPEKVAAIALDFEIEGWNLAAEKIKEKISSLPLSDKNNEK